jgi:hypothetical protein
MGWHWRLLLDPREHGAGIRLFKVYDLPPSYARFSKEWLVSVERGTFESTYMA